MKLFLVSLCTVATATAFVEHLDPQVVYDLLDGKTVVLGPVSIKSEVGKLPYLYPNLTEDDRKASRNARRWLELARPLFPYGIDKVPPLDPYEPVLNRIPLSFLEPLASGTLDLNGVIVSGLKKFKIEELSMRLHENDGGTREDADVSLPTLKAKGDFDADLSLKHLIPLRLSGHFALQLTDIKATASIGTFLKSFEGSPKRVNVDTIKAYLRVAKAQVKVHFDDPGAAQLIKDALDIFPDQSYLEKTEKELGESFLRLAMSEVNKVLDQYTAELLKQLLINGPPAPGVDY